MACSDELLLSQFVSFELKFFLLFYARSLLPKLESLRDICIPGSRLQLLIYLFKEMLLNFLYWCSKHRWSPLPVWRCIYYWPYCSRNSWALSDSRLLRSLCFYCGNSGDFLAPLLYLFPNLLMAMLLIFYCIWPQFGSARLRYTTERALLSLTLDNRQPISIGPWTFWASSWLNLIWSFYNSNGWLLRHLFKSFEALLLQPPCT